MFTLQQSNKELVFGTPTTHHDHASMENNLINFSIGSEVISKRADLGFRRRRGSHDECSMRKVVMHREVEKKRRQEMSNLHASLRSLLPAAQIIKGKGSVCDVMQEAASHIKKMEKKIEELKSRRDELKRNRWFNSSSNDVDEISSNSVTVNTVTDGMEILIKSSYLGLSRVLGELQKIRDDDDDDDEMDVVSIVSTRLINGIFLHKIHVQARDITYLCVLMLQDRLIKAIK